MIENVIEETELLIRSKRTIIYLVSQEETRVITALEQICSKADPSWDLLKWDIVQGIYSEDPEFLPVKESERQMDQEEVLSWFEKLIVPKNKYAVLVLKDFNKYFGTSNYRGQLENKIIRHIKNLSHLFTAQNKTIILISNSYDAPQDLEKNMAVVDWPLPEKKEIEKKIHDLLKKASNRKELADKFQTSYQPEEMDVIVNSFRGLTLNECEQVCTYCMIKHSSLLPDIIQIKRKTLSENQDY